MTVTRWWDRIPARLEAEIEALRDAGIDCEIDKDARKWGVMRLNLSNVKVADEVFDLIVTFPDLYPFFRFEVKAPTLDLPLHQNPFHKNLCLIDRPTENWHTTDTVATLLLPQLPKLLQTARQTDRKKVVGIEAQHAEPYSAYYPYFPGSTVLVQSEWDLGDETCGRLQIGLTAQVETNTKYPLRGVVLKVFNNGNKVLAEADPALGNLTIKKTVDARWVRTQTQGLPGTEEAFFDHIQERDLRSTQLKQNKLSAGCLSIYAAVFPEQHKWRDESGLGWVFVCRMTPHKMPRQEQEHTASFGKRTL